MSLVTSHIARRPEPQIGESANWVSPIGHPQVEKTVGQLFSVGASQSRNCETVEIKL